jgi:transposase
VKSFRVLSRSARACVVRESEYPGPRAVAPEKLLRALLLQAFYSIRSERQLMERLDFDLLFRCFVGLGIDSKATAQAEKLA